MLLIAANVEILCFSVIILICSMNQLFCVLLICITRLHSMYTFFYKKPSSWPHFSSNSFLNLRLSSTRLLINWFLI